MSDQERAAGPILVVDDDHTVRVRLRLVLENAGYVVFTATDGLMALSLMRRLELSPRLVLLDLVMPIMDGWEFLATVRDEAKWRDTAVVLHSSAPLEDLPDGVPRLAKGSSDGEILDVARRYCER